LPPGLGFGFEGLLGRSGGGTAAAAVAATSMTSTAMRKSERRTRYGVTRERGRILLADRTGALGSPPDPEG
jgi:hypothetical protein